MTRLNGAHAIITGGSSGIGLAAARLLARQGATVSLVARRQELLDAAADELRAGGAIVRTASADVSDQQAITAALKELVAEGGPCDVLITSAGLARPGRFLELDDAVYRQMMEVDYFGTLHAIRDRSGDGRSWPGVHRGGVLRRGADGRVRLHRVRAVEVRGAGTAGGTASGAQAARRARRVRVPAGCGHAAAGR